MDASEGVGPRSTADAWRRLGVDGELQVEAAEVIEVHLPFRRPVATAVGVHRNRPLVLVRLGCRRHDGTRVEGWGECAALSDTDYDSENADAAFASLAGDLLPALLGASDQNGGMPSVGMLADVIDQAGRPLAWSAMEMAVGDAQLRSSGTSLAGLLDVIGVQVCPGAVLGLPTSTPDLVADLRRLDADGYGRVKIKIAPGTEPLILDAVAALPTGHLPVQVDANGVYGPATLDGLRPLDGLGLLCIEQPLGRHDAVGHRAMSRAFATPICLDESLDCPDRVVESVTSGECSVVCVKPSRLGGIGAALEVIDWCRSSDTPWWMGGMFESRYARRALATLAALPGPTLPGDLASPSTYLAADLVGPPVTGIDPASGRLLVSLHDAPGVAPVPDGAAVDRYLVRRAAVGIDDG